VLVDAVNYASQVLTAGANLEDLDGNANTLTATPRCPVGNPDAASGFCWFGRATGAGTPSITFQASGGTDDFFARGYSFRGVTKTRWQSLPHRIVQNELADLDPLTYPYNDTAGTSNTVAMGNVRVRGQDALAVGLIWVNDDNTGLTDMAGETGGDWTYPVAVYASSTGSDGLIGIVTSPIAAGTDIVGGSDAMSASDSWGTRTFALLGEQDVKRPRGLNARPIRSRYSAPAAAWR
jgi:hypothetical protein